MPTPTNNLVQVQTYQKAELAWLQNSFYAIRESNKKFRDFETFTANLGSVIQFDRTPRAVTYGGLVITQQPSIQYFQTLACTQAANVSQGFTAQQFIFNVREYMDRFGMAYVKQLGTSVESDLLLNVVSGVTINDPQNALFGTQTADQINSGPFRFYGNGTTPINSFTQLAQACANFRDFGAAGHKMHGLIPEVSQPQIVGTGLNQFAWKRNDEIAETWELGDFSQTEWFISNLLPLHVSGTIGNAAAPNNVITITGGFNDPTGNNVTSFTYTEPTGATSASAIMPGDLLQFNDGVVGQPNMRFLTYIGYRPSQQPVQIRCIAQSSTTAGAGTLTFQTTNGVGLSWASGQQNQNINNALASGMQLSVLPSHRAGLLHSGNQFYLAMPRLPDYSPFESSSMTDKDSGASIRHYWGNQFGQNNQAYVRDLIWASTLVSENSMRLIFPM